MHVNVRVKLKMKRDAQMENDTWHTTNKNEHVNAYVNWNEIEDEILSENENYNEDENANGYVNDNGHAICGNFPVAFSAQLFRSTFFFVARLLQDGQM